MAIIGFLLSFIILTYLTFTYFIAVLIGGSEFSAVTMKDNWYWVFPFMFILGTGWVLLFQNSPFSITMVN